MPVYRQHTPAKKATKKAPAKKAPHPHTAEREARRAYEHLGRAAFLADRIQYDDQKEPVFTLIALAEQSSQAGIHKQSADLLRAAEHIAFAKLLQDDKEAVSVELKAEIEMELSHLEEKAVHHAIPEQMEKQTRMLFETALDMTRSCLEEQAYRSALDWVRAADALAHASE